MADSAPKDSIDSNLLFRDPKTCRKNVESRSVKLSESISSSSTSSSDSSSESSDVWFSDAFALPPAPDGGWGWFVVLGAFFISMICDGCAFSFGVMFVHLLKEFQKTYSETAWVASIFYCLSLLLGPVASELTTRFGCRKVTMLAGLVCCMGFVASAFVTQVWMLYITFSVIVGSGFSVCYVTSVISVAYYFEKRRALATGLSVCGTGIGTFMFAPLCEFLVSIYGWRGTFLILGAICLNITVCGALFRPLKFTPEQRRQRALDAFNRLSRTVSRLSIPSRNRSRLHSTNSESSSTSDSESEDDVTALAFSQITLPTYIQNDEEKIKMYLEKLPELRKVSADPQVVMQRFFKSKDLQGVAKKSPSKTQLKSVSDASPTKEKPGINQQNGTSDEYKMACETTAMLEECEPKKKRRKKSAEKARAAEEVTIENKALSEETMQHLKEKLLISSQDHPVRHHKSRSDGRLAQVSVKDTDTHRLERSASERTPKAILVKAKTSVSAIKSDSPAPPSTVHAQPGTATSGELSVLLMNKHSTYLLLHRNDIFFRGSRSHSLGYCATSCPELSRMPSDSESESEDEECCDCEDRCPCMEGCARSVGNTCDKKMLCHPLFLLFAISNFLLYFWGDVPYVFTADFAKSRGVEEHYATFLISVIGIVNTVGQVFYGFIGDRDWNLTVIYGISCIGSGLAILLLPTANSYWLMAVLCGFFGFFVSANYSLMTVILVAYLGLDKLAHAYGLLMMIQGVANLGGPPVAGWLVDTTGHYGVAFPVAGGFITFSGLIFFLVYVGRLFSRLCQGFLHRKKRRPCPSANGKHSPAKSKNNNAWINGPPKHSHEVV